MELDPRGSRASERSASRDSNVEVAIGSRLGLFAPRDCYEAEVITERRSSWTHRHPDLRRRMSLRP